MIKNKTLKNITIAGFCAFTGLTLAGYAAIISELHSDYIFSKGEDTESWSSWKNVGLEYNCGTWSPLVSDINYGTDFAQSQSCSQNQERTRDVYEEKSDGSKTYLRTEVDNNTITISNSQQETGDKDFILNQTTSAWSAWSNNGGVTNCGSYSPATNTIEYGTSFTQTRYCSQPQERTQTVYNVWAKGSQTVDSTNTGAQTLTNQAQTRTATGNRPLEWDYGTYITGYITSCGSTTTVRPRGSCSTKGATTIACGQVYHPGNNTYYKKSQYTCK